MSDLRLARELALACYEGARGTNTGLPPETWHWITHIPDGNPRGMGDFLLNSQDTNNDLRPEIAESLYMLWKVTGDPVYREWGWELFRAFERWSRVPEALRDADGNACDAEDSATGCQLRFTGYSTVQDVSVIPPGFMNKMETFFIAETLKYLWLLQVDTPEGCAVQDCVAPTAWAPPVLPLRDWILNTEAHPLPVAGPVAAPRVKTVKGLEESHLRPFGRGAVNFNFVIDPTSVFKKLDPRMAAKQRRRAAHSWER